MRARSSVKIKIAEDTPQKLIELFKQIDINKIPENQHNSIIDNLKMIAKQYIPIRTDKPRAKEIELDGCPQRLATVVSQFDFAALGATKRTLGLSFIKSWLKKNNLLKG